MNKFKFNFLDIYMKDSEFIHKLLFYNFKIPLNILDNNNNTLIHLMINNDDTKGINLLLDYIQQFNDTVKFIDFQNSDGNTPMHLAVIKNMTEIADALVSLGANLNIANNNGEIIQNYENNDTDSNYSKSRNNDNDSITSGFFKFLKNQNGGKINKDKIIGVRTLNNNQVDSQNTSESLGLNSYLNKIELIGGKSSRFEGDPKNNTSNDLHKEVLDIIIKYGYSEDDARYIKAGLYAEVKKKFSNLSNLERAKKLKEFSTESNIKDYGSTKKLTKLKQEVDKAREDRKNSLSSKKDNSKDNKTKSKSKTKEKESKKKSSRSRKIK